MARDLPHDRLGDASDSPESLLAQARAQAAREERRRRRLHEAALASEVTGAQLLAGACARNEEVRLVTTAGRRLCGLVAGTGADYVLLRTPVADAYVRTNALVALELLPAGGPVPSAADAAGTSRFDEVVAAAVGTGAEVTIVMPGAGAQTGALRWCGSDVVELERDDGTTVVCYLASVSELSSSSSLSA